jgi:hypothetical protein
MTHMTRQVLVTHVTRDPIDPLSALIPQHKFKAEYSLIPFLSRGLEDSIKNIENFECRTPADKSNSRIYQPISMEKSLR